MSAHGVCQIERTGARNSFRHAPFSQVLKGAEVMAIQLIWRDGKASKRQPGNGSEPPLAEQSPSQDSTVRRGRSAAWMGGADRSGEPGLQPRNQSPLPPTRGRPARRMVDPVR